MQYMPFGDVDMPPSPFKLVADLFTRLSFSVGFGCNLAHLIKADSQ